MLICQKSSDLYWPWDPSRERVQAAFRHAERVYFVSHYNRLLTEEHLAMSLPQAEVIFNPFMVQVAGPLDWPDSEGSPWRLACVGRLYPSEKGQDWLLRVLSRPKWRERDLEVSFSGSGVYGQGLEEMAEYLRLEKVRFCLGHQAGLAWVSWTGVAFEGRGTSAGTGGSDDVRTVWDRG